MRAGCPSLQKKNAARLAGPAGERRTQARESHYDQVAVSAGQEGAGFRELVANLSYQVRTHNTTGKIQELRQEVRSGQYQISPRETAARMLLLEAEE